MTRTARLAVAAGVVGLCGCQDDFPLGSWGVTPAPSSMPTSSASGGQPPVPAEPSCTDVGTPGPFNAPGTSIGTTTLSSDWTWPQPLDSLEWDLVMETDPPTNGYYWAHQFSFVNGLTGFFGLQAWGGYVDPSAPSSDPASKVTFTKMAVYWIAGPPEQGELGDITGRENARVSLQSQGGIDWMTIHAKYEWTACHVYRLRVTPDGTTDTGDIWYAARVADKTAGTDTLIGRILVSADWGQLAAATTTTLTRIDNAHTSVAPPVVTCSDPEPASGIFGALSGNEGTVFPLARTDRFARPARCGTSRFTELTSGVRQEIGLHASTP